jgi:hypothetical protein
MDEYAENLKHELTVDNAQDLSAEWRRAMTALLLNQLGSHISLFERHFPMMTRPVSALLA